MNRRNKLLGSLDLAHQRGLEFGPLNRPTVRRSDGDITYADHLDTAGLRRKYAEDPNVNVADIVTTDVVCDNFSLAAAMAGRPPFDYAVAAHVIEHVPDFIGWLAGVAEVLRPGGHVCLAVPDMRYSFDCLRSPTRLADVLAAHVSGARAPTPHSILDGCLAQLAAVDTAALWRGEAPAASARRTHTFAGALHLARDAQAHGAYHDVHCWAFTPASFAGLCAELSAHGLLDFRCARYIDTARDELEFFVQAQQCGSRAQASQSWSAMRAELSSKPAATGPDRGRATCSAQAPPGWRRLPRRLPLRPLGQRGVAAIKRLVRRAMG